MNSLDVKVHRPVCFIIVFLYIGINVLNMFFIMILFGILLFLTLEVIL